MTASRYGDRVQAGFPTAAFGRALGLLPAPLAHRLRSETRLHCGVDPVYAGLFEISDADQTNAAAMRANGYTWVDDDVLRRTACVVYPTMRRDPLPWDSVATISMPVDPDDWWDTGGYLWAWSGANAVVATVLHEFGHVLDWLTPWSLDPPPLTHYAETNRAEAVAEAFAAWYIPPDDTTAEQVREALGRDWCQAIEDALAAVSLAR